MELFQWLSENLPLVVVALYALLNLLNAVLKLVPGDQGEQPGGWLSTVRSVLDKISLLTNRDAAGTLKAPLTSSKPKE